MGADANTGEVFLARQPIFDRKLEIAGYELLFRGHGADRAIIADHNSATATVVLNAFTEIGLDRIVGSHKAWINADHDFLVHQLAYTLPPSLVGLEILEDQVIDGDLIGSVRALRRHGFSLALDDFRYTRGCDPLLKLADFVKLDLRALGREGMVREVSLASRYGAAVVAEKVETREEHAFCAALGCAFFQGYFFCKPEMMRDRQIESNRLALLQLMAALQDPGVELSKLERLISRDLTLSFRLLRYINSAYFGLRRPVSSIGQALALLGVQNIRRWAALSAFAVHGKPAELTLTALARARFCELAEPLVSGSSESELFMLGLFSVVDALVSAPMDEVLSSIPLADDLREALLNRGGPKGRLLECLYALEHGEFQRAEEMLEAAGERYVEALTWATATAEELAGQAPRPAARSGGGRPVVASVSPS